MTIKCLVISNDPELLALLNSFTKQSDNLVIDAHFDHIEAALDLLTNNDFKIVFLDLDLPKLNEIHFLSSLPSNTRIVLISTQNRFLLESYEYGILDYLKKPITLQRFRLTETKILATLPTSEELLFGDDKKSLNIRVDSHFVRLSLPDIHYIQREGRYVRFFTNETDYLTHLSIQALDRKLGLLGLVRIHERLIINPKKVDRFNQSTVTIRGNVLKIGMHYRKTLHQILYNDLI